MAGRYENRALSVKGRLKLRKRFVSQNDRVFLTDHIGPGELRLIRSKSSERDKVCQKFRISLGDIDAEHLNKTRERSSSDQADTCKKTLIGRRSGLSG